MRSTRAKNKQHLIPEEEEELEGEQNETETMLANIIPLISH